MFDVSLQPRVKRQRASTTTYAYAYMLRYASSQRTAQRRRQRRPRRPRRSPTRCRQQIAIINSVIVCDERAMRCDAKRFRARANFLRNPLQVGEANWNRAHLSKLFENTLISKHHQCAFRVRLLRVCGLFAHEHSVQQIFGLFRERHPRNPNGTRNALPKI